MENHPVESRKPNNSRLLMKIAFGFLGIPAGTLGKLAIDALTIHKPSPAAEIAIPLSLIATFIALALTCIDLARIDAMAVTNSSPKKMYPKRKNQQK